MNATTRIAHDHALRGLLMLLVEVQHQVSLPDFAEVDEHTTARLEALRQIEQLVQGKHAQELAQLARAALDTPVPLVREACDEPLVDRVMGVICVRCQRPVAMHGPRCACPVNGVSASCQKHGNERARQRAIPAAAAGVHE